MPSAGNWLAVQFLLDAWPANYELRIIRANSYKSLFERCQDASCHNKEPSYGPAPGIEDRSSQLGGMRQQ